MDLLKERIKKDGIFINENVLKVDSFLNHQVDTNLMSSIGKEFANYFREKNITKIVTIESSGIAPAYATALELGIPFIIFKKQSSAILDTETTIQTPVHSFTKNTDYILTASKRYLSENDNILIIDDFLANGQAVMGAYRILKEAGSSVAGVGIVIEKSFQGGRKKLEDLNLDIYSLARISKISSNGTEFLD